MKKNVFDAEKEMLIQLTKDCISSCTESEIESLKMLLEILKSYTFENRLNQKGTLAHFVIDSLNFDYSLGERVVMFDNRIN
jgi:hypothetical protein